jgi:hypothetical protein
MRVRVLPRDLAARIINGTVASMGAAVGAITIVTTFPVLVETFVMRGRAAELPLPIALLVVILLGIGAVARWRRVEVVLAYLAVAGAATLGYELALLSGDPGILDTNLYLVNRPTLALVAVGVAAATALTGILWSAFHLVVATSVALAAAMLAGVPFRPGFGPLMVFLVATVGYLTFAAIQAAQRRKLPNFETIWRSCSARGVRSTPAPSNDCARIWRSCAGPSGSRRPPRYPPPMTRTPRCATRSCAWSATSSGAACRSTSPVRAAGSTS